MPTNSRALLFCVLLSTPLVAQTPQVFYTAGSDPTVGICNSIPFGWTSPLSYQTIVAPSELAAGRITSLAFAPCTSGVATYTNLEIRMAHSTSATLSTTFAANLMSPAGGFVVMGRPSVNWNRVADTWCDFPLDRHFAYNGVDYLVIQIVCDAHTGGGACHREAGVRERLVDPNSSSAGVGTIDNAPQKMRIGMGQYYFSDSNDPTVGTCNSFPFAQAQMRYQQLVLASDLGNHPGLVRDIAFAACAAGSVAYSSMQVTIAHTNLTSLSTANTFDSNLQNPPLGQVVLSGPLTYNYVANDWTNLGLTTAFNYNGVDNLIIDIQEVGGTGSSFHRDATRWRAWNTVLAATNPSGAGATALKIRLTMECPPAFRSISAFLDGCGPNPSGPLGIGSDVTAAGGFGLPVLGGTHHMLMRFGPSAGIGAFIIGFSNTSPWPQPVPGAPGCFQRTDIAGYLITFWQPTGVCDPIAFTIPNNQRYCGTTYYVQGVAFWPGANSAGLVSSNVMTMRIGN